MNDRSKQARWLALLAAAAITLYGCWLLLVPLLNVLIWAIVLVITFRPVHRFLRARIGWPNLSAGLASLLVVVALVLPVLLATLAVLREVPGLATHGRDALIQLTGDESPLPADVLTWVGSVVDLESLRSSNGLAEHVTELIPTWTGRLLGFVGGVFGALAQAVMIVYVMFYLFRDGDRFVAWLRSAMPVEDAQAAEVLARTGEMIEASIYGVVVMSVLQGVLGGAAFVALGLPHALIWGAVMILLSMIPVTGAFVVWVPAALYLAATGHWGKAAALTAWGAIIIGTVDNVLRPWVMSQKARMHDLILFFAVLGGLVVFGIVGLVLGPVLVAVAFALIDVIRLSDRGPDAIRREPGLAEQTAQIADASNEDTPAAESAGPGWSSRRGVEKPLPS